MSALKLLTSMASRELLRDLAARFEGATSQGVSVEAAGGVEVAKRIRGGEAADIVVLARNAIEGLAQAGSLIGTSITDIAQSGIAVAVRAGAPAPDVATEESLKRAVIAASSVSFSTGPSGVYLEKIFARWGVLEELRARIVVPPPGVPVGSLVASGSVQVGFQQLSELINLAGIQVLGPLPAAIQLATVFSGAVACVSTRAPAASALLRYLASPEVRDIKPRFGME
jgi:molybdate transport system substrate-binding protein